MALSGRLIVLAEDGGEPLVEAVGVGGEMMSGGPFARMTVEETER